MTQGQTKMMDAEERLIKAAESVGRVIATIKLPARAAVTAAIPHGYRSPALKRYFKAHTGGELYRHQAAALVALRAQNVVVTTPTGSGKSVVFQAPAIRGAERGETTIVLYPVKALASDQEERWRRAVTSAGFDEKIVVGITGDMPPVLRADALAPAKIAAMTPDVVQAWMMSHLANPAVADFLARLTTLVIDEAHVLDGPFGANVAFLVRRLATARNMLRGRAGHDMDQDLRIIAASATFSGAAQAMADIAGAPFTEIGPDLDGSPFGGMTVIHLAPRTEDRMRETAVALQAVLAADRPPGESHITFGDSRVGVERAAIKLNRDDVLPFRNGYEAKDRRAIERKLATGELAGVIATSALEMGIDFGSLTTGATVGLPDIASLRQRIGRVGRRQPGAFAVIAGEDAFKNVGMSFLDAITKSVPRQPLYLRNAFVQEGHARSIRHELGQLGITGDRIALPRAVDWPEGFLEAFRTSRPLPPKKTLAGTMMERLPQREQGLRGTMGGEIAISLGQRQGRDIVIGSSQIGNAIRELHDGATYLHMGRRYRVRTWRRNFFGDTTVYVKPDPKAPLTRARIKRRVAGSLTDAIGIIGSPAAFAACIPVTMTEQVVGYETTANDFVPIQEAFNRRTHRFPTRAVVVRLPEFKDVFGTRQRQPFLDKVLAIYRTRKGIRDMDMRCVVGKIEIDSLTHSAVLDDAIAFVDLVPGGLGLVDDLLAELLPSAELALSAERRLTPESFQRQFVEALRSLTERPAGPLFRHHGETEAFEPCSPALAPIEDGHRVVTLKRPVWMWRDQPVLGYRLAMKAGASTENRVVSAENFKAAPDSRLCRMLADGSLVGASPARISA